MQQTKIQCPRCKVLNTDNWPLVVNGVVMDGGCQDCWEAESDAAWWEFVVGVENYVEKVNWG